MKWITLGLGVVSFAVCAVLGYRFLSRSPKSPLIDSDNIDGGVVHHSSGENSPKEIYSTEITEFDCEFSLLACVDLTDFERAKYRLNVSLKDGVAVGYIKWHNRYNPTTEYKFEANPSFMVELQEIVSKYDFAQYNGYSHFVSGLPDMYGIILSINYSSGESIYTSDNQDNLVPLEAVRELVDLFTEEGKKATQE